MAKNKAYVAAEAKIAEALRSGATELDLRGNYEADESERLQELPRSLSRATQLRDLDLSYNALTDLPEWFGSLVDLQWLDLSVNYLTSLPSWLGELSELHWLDVSYNALEAIPDSLSQLGLLRTLNFSRNPSIGSIPEWIGCLSRLQRLTAYGNGLTSLPSSIVQLRDLEVLSISGNRFTSLPNEVYDLRELRELYASGNQIVEVSSSISKLQKLEKLILGGKRISADITISDNTILGNEIVSLPTDLVGIHSLIDLDLDNNPLAPELAIAYSEGIDAVTRYLRAKAEAQVALNEAKLILIGEGEVGKSCLLGALRGDPWEDGRLTTHGIEIKPVKVTDSAAGTEITLNGWDFGGQRVYRPTHQLFFSSPAVYLVVWKPREGPQAGAVKEWIKLVKHRAPEARIIVVATHGGPGGRQPDIDRQELWDLFGRDTVVDFIHVDSRPDERTGQCRGITELRDAIAHVAVNLPEMGRTVPKRWQEVRVALKNRTETYLSLERVLAICKKHKIDEDDALLLLRISSRIGDLIYYEHDMLLGDLVILKPDWLATAISFVLDDANTRYNHGLASFQRLRQLWNHRARAVEFRYPPKLHRIFLRLMERFDLCYRVPGAPLGGDENETSLIAQLVPDVRPAEEELERSWPLQMCNGDEQQVQICRIVDASNGQSAVAEGLFYQLIVRLHKFSLGRKDFQDSVHWQRGLIVDDEYNGRALLEHVGNDVHITVRAAYPGNLLAVLTREVKWLVENFWQGLRCEVVVPCIDPCGKKRPGTGVFEVQKLIAFRRQGMIVFPCTVSGCDRAQDIDCLLQNAPAAQGHAIESLLSEGFADLRSRLEDLRKQNLVLDQNLRRIMSQVEDAFRNLMQTMTDDAKEGPRLFSMEPLKRSGFNPKNWTKKKFRVTLWCEHTRLPLPLLNKNDEEGVYEFEVTREWFVRAAPFLKIMAGTLSLVLPVAASATKLTLDEATYKGLEKQLDFGKSCAEAMFKTGEKSADWLTDTEGEQPDRVGVIRAYGGVLREFQTWLKQTDPSYGDLRRVLNKQKEFMWVHRDYESEY